MKNMENEQNVASDTQSLRQEEEHFEYHIEKKGVTTPEGSSIDFPPGMVGDLAYHFLKSSIRPVPEVALTAAIGMTAGIAGRAYHVNGSGLNLYLILLAKTGIGKEAINSGISKFMTLVYERLNDEKVLDFVGPSQIASGQGLFTHLSDRSQSFVSIIGEMGLFMGSMSGMKASEHKKSLRSMMLDLYSKSDLGQSLQGAAYAKKEDSKKPIKSPAFSMIGESTPIRFYESLNEELIAEGLISRFMTIEYKGLRPKMNSGHYLVKPDDDLLTNYADLCQNSMMFNKENARVEVVFDDEARQIMDQFNDEVDDIMNSGESEEIIVQLWNRIHLKAMRLAAVVAVGMPRVPGDEPFINAEVARWAIDMVKRDVMNIKKRFEDGEVGEESVGPSEKKQIDDMRRAIRDFIEKSRHPESMEKNYKVSKKMVNDRCIPYSYIQTRLANLASFKKDRLGATQSIRRTLDILMNRGDLVGIGKPDMAEKYGIACLGYQIRDIRTFTM